MSLALCSNVPLSWGWGRCFCFLQKDLGDLGTSSPWPPPWALTWKCVMLVVGSCSVLGCSWFSFHTLISYISAYSLPSRLPGKGLKLLLNISISPGGHLFSRDCLGLSTPSPAAGSCCSDKLELGEAGQQALSHRVPGKHSSALLRPRVAQPRLALRPNTTWQQPPAAVNITVLTGPQLSKLIWLNLIRLRGTFDLWN